MTRSSLLAAAVATIALTLASPSPARGGQAPGENPPKTFEKIAEKAPAASDASKRQGFSVVLLLGDMKGPDAIDTVPSSAKKALADLKDFLPYKNYRLLDSQWTLCCSGAAPAITRLRGPDDVEYELELRASPTMFSSSGEPTPLAMRFILRELWDSSSSTSSGKTAMHPDRVREMENKQAVAAQAEAQSAEIGRELFTLERERATLMASMKGLQQSRGKNAGEQEDIRAQLENARVQLNLVVQRIEALRASQSSLPQTKGGVKPAMDASFRMTVGETVVVGTSGLRGGSRALIALLTAVDKKK